MAHTDNNLPLSALLAALVVAGKGDIRFYLNSVRVETDRDGNAIIVGCNGHCLLAINTACPWKLPHLTIPRDVVEQLGKLKPTWVEFGTDGTVFTAKAGGSTLTFADTGGTYPDWQQVVPRNTTPGGSAIALEYMLAAANVCKALKPELSKRPQINVSANGEATAFTMSFGDLRDDSPVTNTMLVVMPMRGYKQPSL